MDEASVAGDFEDQLLCGFLPEFAVFLDSSKDLTYQRAQADSIYLGHSGGPAMAEVSGSQLSAEGQL